MAQSIGAQSLGGRLDELKGIGPGFDHLRIGLSLSILLWHSASVSYGVRIIDRLAPFPVPPLLGALLPMFFALSGFLVMGSALRTADLRTFVTFRMLRILPALLVEILISALLLGPLLTTLPLGRYFGDPRFFEYFGSLIGRVRFILPGLFVTNPQPEYVNFALWTVGPEILCYLFLAAFILTGIYLRPRAVWTVALLYVAICLFTDSLFPGTIIGEVLPARLLILAFLLGNLAFLHRHSLRFSPCWAAMAFLIGIGLILLRRQEQQAIWGYLAIPPLVYAVAVVGLMRLPPMPFFRRGDYSYGIYIYGFPIQQAVAHFLPAQRIWWVNFGLALPVTLLFAVGSWHLIEKPCLDLRKTILMRAANSRTPATSWRRPAILLFILIYGLFVLDASRVLPVRPMIKAASGRS